MLMMCGESTRSVLLVLAVQIVRLSSMACSPSTCNMDYAMTCLRAAQRVLFNTTDTEASEEVCRSVFVSFCQRSSAQTLRFIQCWVTRLGV